MSRLSTVAGVLLTGGGLFFIYYDWGIPLVGCAKCWIRLLIDIIFISYGAILLAANFSKKEIPAVAVGK